MIMKLLSQTSGRPQSILQKGFTLVEALVGMAVMGTVVGALMSGITTGFFTMQMARENLRATQILLEKMETIRLYSWDQVTSPTNFIPPTFTASYDPQGGGGGQGLTYNGTLDIMAAPIGSSYANDMRLVRVTLQWTTGKTVRNREFVSFVSRYGMQDYIY